MEHYKLSENKKHLTQVVVGRLSRTILQIFELGRGIKGLGLGVIAISTFTEFQRADERWFHLVTARRGCLVDYD